MREVETKFRVNGDFTLPALAPDDGAARDGSPVAHAEARGTTTLVATYFDTRDLRLARAGVTLRRRTGGDDEGWHLKLPTGREGVREEVRRPLASGSRSSTRGRSTSRSSAQKTSAQKSGQARSRARRTGDEQPPEDLLALVRARVRRAPLRPVVTLETERTAVMLRDAEGHDLAEVVDDVVRVKKGDHVSARFREVEVEDRGGGDDVLAAVGATLEEAGAVRGEVGSKLRRALGQKATAPADPPPPPDTGPKKAAGTAVTAYLRHHVARLLAEDPRVRLDEDDAVHQMRVSARRLRSGLRTFGPLVDPEWARPLRDELKWLGGELSDARDLEVLRARLLADADALDESLERGNARQRLERHLTRDLEEALTRARAALETDRYVDLVERLVEGATAPPLTAAAERPAREVLPGLVRGSWKKLAKRARRVRGGRGDSADLHAVRIAAKRVRYASEAVAPALGKPPRRLARRCERLQDRLGEHQDATVAAEAVREIAGRRGIGAAAFTLGVLHEREQARAADVRGEFDPLWADVSRPKLRRWLES